MDVIDDTHFEPKFQAKTGGRHKLIGASGHADIERERNSLVQDGLCRLRVERKLPRTHEKDAGGCDSLAMEHIIGVELRAQIHDLPGSVADMMRQ
jgi:hypothetical protein